MFPLLYIRSIIKLWGKGKKLRESMLLSIYRVYIIKEYKDKQRCGKKVAGKVRCGKECSISVYRYSIIEKGKRKGAGQRYSHYI